ncbi:PRTRC system protein B [Dyadobacter frigoris]|uniref:PRTRC system protein B n=1 Tax=Dyadobacter frigoris TaxID=2576211 RepID=A0A4V6BH57_9BACT|nr:PRTRC system protein B [Dyadobacter frigoris]TKT84893.1 PRTRC system protein B [Dyadobacter frigoris]
MKDITAQLGELYFPKKVLVLYQSSTNPNVFYIEAYDMDKNGHPVNVHPLSVKESQSLAKTLDMGSQLTRRFLTPRGLMPQNILHINPAGEGCVIWHTPAGQQGLLFSESLGIPNGNAYVPAMLWKASAKNLHVYALKSPKTLSEETALYKAPFFNIHPDGRVCMGTVAVDVQSQNSLEDFISSWQQYFFGSYFSHLIEGQSPVKGSVVQLWQNQVQNGCYFPVAKLIKTGLTLKDILP